MQTTKPLNRSAIRAKRERRCRCGRTFRVRNIGQEYCSRSCSNRWRTPSTKVKRRCEGCGSEFEAWPSEIKRGYGKYCSRRCSGKNIGAANLRTAMPSGSAHPAYKHGRACKPTPSVNHKRFRSGQETCQHPEHTGRTRLCEHHVIYEQCVRREKGDVSDGRNALRICNSCHAFHHHRSKPLPLTALRDANYEFAFELLGAAAYNYLRRRYAGDDPRLREWLRKTEAATASAGE